MLYHLSKPTQTRLKTIFPRCYFKLHTVVGERHTNYEYYELHKRPHFFDKEIKNFYRKLLCDWYAIVLQSRTNFTVK